MAEIDENLSTKTRLYVRTYDKIEAARNLLEQQAAAPSTGTTSRKTGFVGSFQIGADSGDQTYRFSDDVYKPDQDFFESNYMGRVIHEKNTENYWTVIGVQAEFISQDMADDMDIVGPRGGFAAHWSVTCFCRTATDEEAGSKKAKENMAARKKRLVELCDHGGDWAHMPDRSGKLLPDIDAAATDRVLIWNKVVGYSLHQAWRTSIGLLATHPVYDDSPTCTLRRWENMTPEDAEIIRTAPEIQVG